MHATRPSPARFGDRFELRGQSGSGGMGTVFRAHDLVTGEEVALKILHEQQGAAAERFGQEAALLAELAHPAIVRYVDHGVTPAGEHYLAMEWLEGETLDARLERGAVGPLEAALLGKRVLEALALAHRRGIVHRDLKPGNLFLPGGDLRQVKLLDFGIARRMFDTRRMTMTGAALGTPMYMSPEQVRGARAVDARSDVFSLGCVLYECATGEPPFTGETPMAVLAKICLDEPVGVAARCPELPAELAVVLERMLDKDPTRRPASASALASELGEVASRLAAAGIGAAPSARPRRTAALATGEQRVVSAILVARPRQDAAGEPRAASTWDLPRAATSQIPDESSDDDALTRIRAAVEPFGARAERFLGGSLVVTLAGQGTPTDQAAQAARCALKLKSMLPGIALAVSTGRAVVAGELPLGDLIDGAARLLVGEAAGSVRLDETTARLVEARFEVSERDGRRHLLFEKGMKEAPRTLLGKEIPCVGRDRELGTLQAIYDECVNEPVARAVLVTAPAGGGKSRVRHELLERIAGRGEPFEALVGRGESLRAGAPFALLGPALRHAAGIVGGEPAAVQQKRLAAHVARHVPAAQTRRVAAFLGEIAGVPFDDADLPALHAARQDPRLMADQTLAAWLDYLEAGCAAHPVVLVLEDLHWGDAPSVQLVDAALRTLRERPLLVLAFARPEVDERFPGLWNERDLQRMALPPLTPKAAGKLARAALADLPPEKLAPLIERADGNPFYLEELLRALAAGGDAAALPDTVIGMVQARFDALGDEAKRVLRAAAVYGQSCRPAAVRALLPDEGRTVNEWLEILSTKEVLFTRQASDGREYVFRHALMQEAAYDMLPPADRVLGHRLAGEFLEASGEPQAIVLVEHFERGGEPKRAAGWCRYAAEQALDANDLGAAIERVERGVRLGAEGEVLGALRIVEVQAALWRNETARAESAGREATRLSTGAQKLRAVAELITVLGRASKYDEIRNHALANRERPIDPAYRRPVFMLLTRAADWMVIAGDLKSAEQIVAQLDITALDHDSGTLTRVHHLYAKLARGRGDRVTEIRELRKALAEAERTGNAKEVCGSALNLAVALGEIGLLEEGRRYLESVVNESRKLGLDFATFVALVNLIPIVAQSGDVIAARELADQALQMSAHGAENRFCGVIHFYLARIALEVGDIEEAEARSRIALTMLRTEPALYPAVVAVSSMCHLARGEVRRALEEATAAYDAVENGAAVEDGEITIHIAYAQALQANGNVSRARGVIESAWSRINQTAQLLDDPSARSAFVTGLWENREVKRLLGL